MKGSNALIRLAKINKILIVKPSPDLCQNSLKSLIKVADQKKSCLLSGVKRAKMN